MKYLLTIGVLAMSVVSGVAIAKSPVATHTEVDCATADPNRPTRGFWNYEDCAKPKPKAAEPVAINPEQTNEQKDKPKAELVNPDVFLTAEEKCKRKDLWTSDCGFTDPGEDFEFQSKQRDELLQQAVMKSSSPKAVEAAQRYMKFILDRSTQMANIWMFNKVQNPELDADAVQPISTIGSMLMSKRNYKASKTVIEAFKEEGAFLVYFSKTECAECKTQLPILKRFSEDYGLPVYVASLGSDCPAGVEPNRCYTAPQTIEPAKALAVTIVPTVFLYMDDNWIRISNGLATADTLRDRVVKFGDGIRSAMLKGLESDIPGRPAVDFSSNPLADPEKQGVERTGPVPTESEMRAIAGTLFNTGNTNQAVE